MSEALFTWQEYTYAIENTEELSKNMMRFPMQNILTGNVVMQGFNADSIRGILEMLNPSQVNIVWASSGFLNECTVTEKWFDVRFMPWCDENLVEWKKAAENHWQNRTSIKEFQLPTPNKYIVTDFKIIVADVEKKLRKRNHLVRLRDNKWAKLWWKLDDKFQARISWGIHGLP
jgi:secreted Zn-dependent insulinase-like peptidase